MDLKASNPASYSQLISFERKLNEGILLPGAEELKRFGQALSKGFKPGKGRSETIAALLLELSGLLPDDIETAVRHAESGIGSSDAGEFKQLAHFLIGRKAD